MTKEDIFNIIVNHTKEVIPGLEDHAFVPTDSLKNLGANSIDRAEIIMMTLESINLFDAPMVDFARVENIGELANSLYTKLEESI